MTKWYGNGYSEIPFAWHIDNRDYDNSYTWTIDYQTEVFCQPQEIEYIVERLEYILWQIVKSEDKLLKDISIIPLEEQKKLLLDFNNTAAAYPKDKCVHELFTEQAKRTPERTALVFEDKKFTYRELDEMSNSLAVSLRDRGVGRGDKVAVLLKRNEAVILTQLAVLKNGAVFIPVDSRYPKERIKYILDESKAKIIIKNADNPLVFENMCNIEQIDMTGISDIVNADANPEDICYIIFTSGSTGKPKGCTLTGKGLVNFCINNNILESCNRLDRQVCISVNTISFDFFIAESLMPLLNGYTVVLTSEEESTNQALFKETVLKTQANIIQTTPTRYKLYFDDKEDISYTKQFDVMVASGEALPFDLLKKFVKMRQVISVIWIKTDFLLLLDGRRI